ncbi:MAG TPA: rhomboid family intramembrane serine protease, partial [Vicinamibacterales bacterium]|nr:rhomboid family intramembrane serine protease [Vicinamibacterales bacterium]
MKAIMIANVAVFVLTFFAPALVVRLGLRPADLFGEFAVWQLVTYMFVHAGLSHIFFNMLTLYFVGVELERIWGTKYFTK